MENREITREDYRYGYQGQYSEKDKETGWNAFELRMYDARIGRWTSKDPKGQFYSPYIGMGNNPVTGTDPDGGYSFFGNLWRKIFIGGPSTPANGYLGRFSGSFIEGALKTIGSATLKGAEYLGKNPGFLTGLANSAINSQGDSRLNIGQLRAEQGKYLLNSYNSNSNNCCPGLYVDLLVRNPAVARVATRVGARTAGGWAVGLAEPSPVGEIVMTGVTVTLIVVESINVYNEIDKIHNLNSKGGKQNLWDDELSPLSNEALAEEYFKAKRERNKERVQKIQKEQKRRGSRNKQKR